MIKAIILDYNGVIVDTDKFDKKAIRYACRELDIPFSKVIYEKYFIGRSLVSAARQYLKINNKNTGLKNFVANKISFDRHYLNNIIPHMETIKFINYAKKNHILALVTGARRTLVNQALRLLKINKAFSVIVTSEDYEEGKPYPDSYNKAVSLLNIPKNEIIVIEDHALGIKAAKSAGLKCLAISRANSKESLKEADFVVEKLNYKKQREIFF